jgi:hypothetical protein
MLEKANEKILKMIQAILKFFSLGHVKNHISRETLLTTFTVANFVI